jgi:hypothetical protein
VRIAVAAGVETASGIAVFPAEAAVEDLVALAPLEAVPEAAHEPAVPAAPPAWEVRVAAGRAGAAAAGAGE